MKLFITRAGKPEARTPVAKDTPPHVKRVQTLLKLFFTMICDGKRLHYAVFLLLLIMYVMFHIYMTITKTY